MSYIQPRRAISVVNLSKWVGITLASLILAILVLVSAVELVL